MNDEDCDFSDEEEEMEDNYRSALQTRGKLSACPRDTNPVESIRQRCTLCTRQEAEDILKQTADIEPGHFILRPSIHSNHPYSLSVVENDLSICHFQIGQIGREYLIGPLDAIDINKAKKFHSIASLLDYHLTIPITFVENKQKHRSICLRLYCKSNIEITCF